MGSFSTSLSGLDAEEQALSVISNDLSNLNTTAFKTGTPVFSNMFYQMLGTDGAGDPVQVGVGATMSSVDSPFTQGNVSSTGVPTDVAIEGNGLFIVNQNGTQVYTRAGNFTLNNQGNLIDSNGNDVMGYSAVNGTINTSGTLAPIVISMGETFPPSATSTVELDMNLDAADPTQAAATGTLTVPAPTLPTAGQTATIAGTTYTFASSITGASPADTVLIGGTAAETLANLAGAINASNSGGQAAGTTYSSGTVANTSVSATVTDNVLSLQALNSGAAGNSLTTSAEWTAGSFAGADLSGGVSAAAATATLTVGAGTLPNAGDTVDVGGTTYTFADSITGASPANTVLIGADVPSTLANLAAAINATPADSGTTFSSSTVANTSATATGSTNTTLTLQAINSGTGGNAIATTTDWAGVAFGAADMTGGVDAATATGAYTVPLSLPTAGEVVTVGATTYTFVGSTAGLTSADSVLIGPDVGTTMANLAGAINAATTGGQGAGTTYGTGTVANASVTATGSTATSLSLQAITSGSTGDSTATTSTWSAASFGSADLTGGTDAGTYSDSIPIYDSLGNSHILTFNFTKTSSGDWSYQITIPAADVGSTGAPQVVAGGTLQFDSSGNLVSPSANVAGTISNLTDGASTLDFNWTLFNSSGTPVITQTAETSATSAKDANGYSAGTLQSYTIGSDGTVDGVLSNDQTVALGQIALATFPNYDGLTNLGSNDYQASLASGAATVGTPGSGGRGTLEGDSLEGSNVDIATAFTELIQAERGYEANAKAITTADNVMQASIALIQG
jgi:flagellar hook protein FlgE